jgi:hypothetical protein
MAKTHPPYPIASAEVQRVKRRAPASLSAYENLSSAHGAA